MKNEHTKIVTMKWNEAQQKFLMRSDTDDDFLYDFWDCKSVKCMFLGLSRKKKIQYELTVRRIGEVAE